MTKYIAYQRVSTRKQGRSGLGLEAQRSIIRQYVDQHSGEIIAEYTEVQTGTRKRIRPELAQAIRECRRTGATLLIAKLDRLARDVEFTFKVVNSGISICFCDMPCVNTLTLGIFATVAQYEAELISQRTKAALAARKAQGYKLGRPDMQSSDSARAASGVTRRAIADANSTQYIDLIRMYRAEGMTLQQIADTLNAKGFTTARGRDFKPGTVDMYLKRLG